MTISLKQLEVFTAVVVAGSITKASRRIGLSQPSISQQVAKLESALGTQLILRNRTGHIQLTATGEFWFKSASDLLKRYDAILADHTARFSDSNVVIRLGSTPTLRGRFTGAVARIALQEDKFARFEQFWGLNSAELVERLRLHQLNCVMVNSVSIEEAQTSFTVTPLFRDRIAWVVPRHIPVEDLREAIEGDDVAMGRKHTALGRFVTVGPGAPMQPASDNWYRDNMPSAMPVFGTMSYISAVDLVAEGLATTHCPLSLLPNLPASAGRKLRWLVIDGLARDIVLAMPRHLLTLPAYARFHDRLQEFSQTEYQREMTTAAVQPLESIFSA